MGNLDEAERCFKKVVKSSKRYTQAGAYNYLSGLEKTRKNYKDALFTKNNPILCWRLYIMKTCGNKC